jgi:hypothetical protein
MQTRNSVEYEKFASLTDKLLKVPHSELKAKLEAEKKAKKKKTSTKQQP